jgi:hypothetical protein
MQIQRYLMLSLCGCVSIFLLWNGRMDVDIVVAIRLVGCQRGSSVEEGKVLRPESLPDRSESSAAWELGSTARKTSGDYYTPGGFMDVLVCCICTRAI